MPFPITDCRPRATSKHRARGRAPAKHSGTSGSASSTWPWQARSNAEPITTVCLHTPPVEGHAREEEEEDGGGGGGGGGGGDGSGAGMFTKGAGALARPSVAQRCCPCG
ncbi:unnamed protein product [Prorocentrum cordatum]|uniref:Uncharacterized protein n=1 Tax=Prorocentrum cordatum TaxID=2364126 RepID=A0ABN9QKN8_9DINO|nr:unnamed protein product [Polarella glacialis]